MQAERKFKTVGTRPVRPDGVDKVTGRANFGADFSLPGMLWGRVLRSPHAHARISSIDTNEAASLPGVKAVITHHDFPNLDSKIDRSSEALVDFRHLSRNCMAREKVLYHGHALAAVAATTQAAAERALAAIQVKYEVLPHVLDPLEAMEPDAPLLHDDLFTKGVKPRPDSPSNIASRRLLERGDIEAGFAEADVVIEREFETAPVHQGYIEPHAALAQTGEDGRATIWCCTQGHFMVRSYSAHVLGMDISQIHVIPSEIGGGFGGKTTVYIEPLAILLSRRAGRPVKMVMSREEVFRASGPASGTAIRVRIGARRDGTLVAASARLAYEAGAFPGSPVDAGLMSMFAAYDIPNLSLEGLDVVVNKPKVAAYRAPGAPMAAYAAETVLDEIARELEIDPIDLRLANAARQGTHAVYGPVFREIGFVETLEAARDHPHYNAPLGPNQGRGVASGFWFNGGNQSSAALHINEDGNAVVVSSNPDIGGSRASLAMMAAEELGIDISRVQPVVGDTETIGYSDPTGGSRVTFATGMAVVESARDVIRQLCERAALIWGIEPEEVEWRDGAAHARTNGDAPKAAPKTREAWNRVRETARKNRILRGVGRRVLAKSDELRGRDATRRRLHDPNRDLSEPILLEELAQKTARMGGPITSRSSINARGAGPGFGTHICDVEIDPETGVTRVIRYTAIQDVGRAIHPSYVEGQLQGGAVQGIGWALNEGYVFDAAGRMQNPGFLDYRIPVASDLPMIDTVLVEVPNPRHPYGVRGVGEVPIVPPIGAVANAIHNAVGVRLCELPMSPPRILAALEERG